MATRAWWERLDPIVQDWLMDNNGVQLPTDVARAIVAAGGEAAAGQTLPDEVVDWIEAVANEEPAG
jgi:hypothetical protein